MELVDTFGRVHRDLRIAITDRCNFRCQYCMPVEGMVWMPREGLLTFEEIERLARLMVDRYGVDSIRLTGGEPTIRAHLPRLVEMLAKLNVDLAMTTNGATLRLQADALRDAGLRRINISLDSLRHDRFIELTRRDDLDQVLDGIDAAVEAGFDPVKINVVLMNGVNDDEVADFAKFGRDKGVTIRFIEFMPLDADPNGSCPWPASSNRSTTCFRSRRLPARRLRLRDTAISTVRERSGSSLRSPRSSAIRATESGSPPTGSSVTACSPTTITTFATQCGLAPPTPKSPRSSRAQCTTSGRATESTRFTSSDPNAT